MSEPVPVFEVLTGKFKGRRIQMSSEELLIGRGESARLRIPSLDVSREHCRLVYKNRRLQVEDLQSRNGTFINGRPIAGKRFLAPGSTLTIGPVTFLLLGNGPPPERPSVEILLPGRRAFLPGANVTANVPGNVPDFSEDDVVNWLAETIQPSDRGSMHQETAEDIPLVPPAQFMPRKSHPEFNLQRPTA